MICINCNTAIPDTSSFCLSCGEKVVSLQEQKKKQEKLLTFFKERAQEGIVTFEVINAARVIGKKYQKADKDLTYEVFGAYVVAYHAFILYSDFLHMHQESNDLARRFRLLVTGNVERALVDASLQTDMITIAVSKPSIARWLFQCVCTMLFMDILQAGTFDDIIHEIVALSILCGEDFWKELFVLAGEANKYRTKGMKTRDAMEAFMDKNSQSVDRERKLQLKHAMVDKIAELITAGTLIEKDKRAIYDCMIERFNDIDKEYDLIIFVELVKVKWKALSGLVV